MRTEFGSMTGYAKVLFLTIPDGYWDTKRPTLEDDGSSFKAILESLEHQKVVERVLDSLIGVTCCVLEDLSFYPDKDMWHLARKYDKISTSFIM
jgi:hypothetical protein